MMMLLVQVNLVSMMIERVVLVLQSTAPAAEEAGRAAGSRAHNCLHTAPAPRRRPRGCANPRRPTHKPSTLARLLERAPCVCQREHKGLGERAREGTTGAATRSWSGRTRLCGLWVVVMVVVVVVVLVVLVMVVVVVVVDAAFS